MRWVILLLAVTTMGAACGTTGSTSADKLPVSLATPPSTAVAGGAELRMATVGRQVATYRYALEVPELSGVPTAKAINTVFSAQAGRDIGAFVATVPKTAPVTKAGAAVSTLICTSRATRIDRRLLSVRDTCTSAFAGAASPTETVSAVTVNLASGKVLTLGDVLRPPGVDRFRQAVAARIEARYGEAAVASTVWDLTTNSIEAVFQPGRVGPVVSGPVAVGVPLSGLGSFLTHPGLFAT